MAPLLARSAISLGFLVLGCAAEPRPPVSAPVWEGACRVEVLDHVPSGSFVQVARVSADLPEEADARAAVEQLAGAACAYGADALLPTGAEPLIPHGPERPPPVVVNGVAVRVLEPPLLDGRWRREHALALRLAH